MNTLKQLNEKLGEARKRKAQAVKDRASKIDQLEAQFNSEDADQEKETKLRNEIKGLKASISDEDELIEMYTDQIQDLSDVQNYDSGIPQGGFSFEDGKSEKVEASQYRMVKALREALEGGPQNLTGIEKEMQQEAIKDAKEKGIKLQGNLHVPQIVVESRQIRNDLTVTGGTGGDQGGVTVQTDVMPLIDILRSKLPFVDSNATTRDGLGATFFTDLSGDISFPRATEGADPAEKGETAEADEVSPTLGEFTLSPNRLPGHIEVSRQLLFQSSVSVENWVRNHLMYKIAKPMQANIITAILNAAGTNPIVMGDPDGGAPTWPKIVEFETAVLDADAATEDEPRLGYLSNSKVRGTLKTTEKASNTAQYLWNGDNEVNNYPAVMSSLVPKNLTKGTGTDLSAMIFANWASLYIAQWGGISFLVNPYSRDKEGLIRINAWTFYDHGMRHAIAFSVAKDIITNS